MNTKKLGIGAAALAAAGAIVVGGVTVSNASAASTPSTRVATAAADTTTGPQGRSQDGSGGAGQDTPVTGDEATKVAAAVTAKDSAVTVQSVRKDPDGSYDVLGTKAGATVMFDVSADLATVTENALPADGAGHGPRPQNGQTRQGQAQQGQTQPGATSTS